MLLLFSHRTNFTKQRPIIKFLQPEGILKCKEPRAILPNTFFFKMANCELKRIHQLNPSDLYHIETPIIVWLPYLGLTFEVFKKELSRFTTLPLSSRLRVNSKTNEEDGTLRKLWLPRTCLHFFTKVSSFTAQDFSLNLANFIQQC